MVIVNLMMDVVTGMITDTLNPVRIIFLGVVWGIGTYALRKSMRANPTQSKAILGAVLLAILLVFFLVSLVFIIMH